MEDKYNKWQVTPNVTRKAMSNENTSSLNNALIQRVRAKLGDDSPLVRALEASAIDMLPETSIHKEMLKRKNVAGADPNHGRALAAHVNSAAWYRGQLEHGRDIQEGIVGIRQWQNELRNMPDKEQANVRAEEDAVREIQRHIAMDTNDEIGSLVRVTGNMGFLFMLLSPAYVLINMTQPVMFALPWLRARKGSSTLGASRALLNAYLAVGGELRSRGAKGFKGMFSPDGVDPELFDFLEQVKEGDPTLALVETMRKRLVEAGEKGLIDDVDNTIEMLRELSERNVMDFSLTMDVTDAARLEMVSDPGKSIMDRARIIPHLAEVLNRSVTAVAAYQIAIKRGDTVKEATAFAEQAVVNTQFDYTLMNKPRYMSERTNQLLKPIFMFMQHPQHVYALFVQSSLGAMPATKKWLSGRGKEITPEEMKEFKEGATTMLGILGTHLMMAGTTGALFEPIKWAMGLALLMMEAITGEPPEETEVYMERFLVEQLGVDFGELASNGFPALVGLHLSDNLSISSLALRQTPASFSLDRAGVQDATFSALGPIPTFFANAAQGVNDMQEGDTLGGLSRMMPRALRDITRAFNYNNEGLRDSRGNAIMESSEFAPHELFLESMGIRTREKARAYSDKAAIDSLKQFHRKRQQRLKERLWRARGDAAATRRVQQDIDKYNASVPWNARIPRTISSSKYEGQRTLQEMGSVLSDNQRWMAEKGRIWSE